MRWIGIILRIDIDCVERAQLPYVSVTLRRQPSKYRTKHCDERDHFSQR
jgi:hypothetical protein